MKRSELKVLRKYLNESLVEEEDSEVLDKFRSVGYVRYGATCERDEIKPTAKLTKLGEKIYKANLRIF